MADLTSAVRAFLEANPEGVVGTTRPDGTVRQSVTYFVLEGDTVLISTESKRAKARDVRRTAFASLCVMGHTKPFPAATVEGPASIRTEGIGGPTARIMEVILGAPVDPPTDEDLAGRDRVILEIDIANVYAVNYIQGD